MALPEPKYKLGDIIKGNDNKDYEVTKAHGCKSCHFWKDRYASKNPHKHAVALKNAFNMSNCTLLLGFNTESGLCFKQIYNSNLKLWGKLNG